MYKHYRSFGVVAAFLLALFGLIMPVAEVVAKGVTSNVTYYYYGQQLSSEKMAEISAQRFYKNRGYTDCVYVPSADYSPYHADVSPVYECFNTFNARLKVEFEGQIASSNTANTDASVSPTSCLHWALYQNAGYNGWLNDVCR